MYPSINIGSVAFPTAGLVYIFGVYVCLALLEKSAGRIKQNPETLYALGTIVVAVGVIAARLFFVGEYWAAYRSNLLAIVWPLNSGYNNWAGVLAGAAAGFFYARWKRLTAADTLDALAPGLLAGFIVISLADFLGGPGYGTTSSLPWAVSQFGIARHPVQLYEILFALLAFGVWWHLTKRPYPPGAPFLWATALYSAGRLFTDAYRANTPLTPQGFHLWQIAAFVMLLLSLLFLRKTIASEASPPG